MPETTAVSRTSSMIAVSMLSALFKQRNQKLETFDGIEYEKCPEQIQSFIELEKPDFLFIVFWYESQVFNPSSIRFIEQISKYKTKQHVTGVGRGASLYHEDILAKYPVFDSVILGEYEKTALELFDKVTSSDSWKDQPGIVYLNNGELVTTEPQGEMINPNGLPFADSSYLENRRLYPLAVLSTSRFCYGQCNFCLNKVFYKKLCTQYQARDARLVVDEIEEINQKYGTRTFYFADNNFFTNGKLGVNRAREIARLLLERGLKIRFQIAARVNEIEIELFTLLKKAGLRKVFLGIESGYQPILDRYQKQTTVEMNKNAVDILRSLKINWEPGFILFDPLTTIQELKENINFINEMELYKCKSPTGSPLLSSLTIFKGSDVENIFPPNVWLENNGLKSIRRYRILDERANVVRELLNWYQREIHTIFNHIQIEFRRKESQFDEKQKIEFHKEFIDWQSDLSEFDVKVLEKLIQFVDGNNYEAESIFERAKDLVHSMIEKNIHQYFTH